MTPTDDIPTLLARAIHEADCGVGKPFTKPEHTSAHERYATAILATPSGKAILDRLARDAAGPPPCPECGYAYGTHHPQCPARKPV